MGRGRKSTVGGIQFESNKDLTTHARSYVECVEDGGWMSQEGVDFHVDLIRKRHREPEEKLLLGLVDQIVGIRVRHQSGCPQYGNSPTNRNHTYITYSCGLEIDYSWRSCCNDSFSDERDADQALRRAAAAFVYEFKKRRFMPVGGMPTCDATGKALTWRTCEVDHYPVTWTAVRDRFLLAEGKTLGEIETVSDPRGGGHLADDDLRKRFDLFHAEHATLRLVTVEVNRKSWRDPEAERK